MFFPVGNRTQPSILTSLNYSLIRHQARHSFFVESPPFPWPAFQKPHNVLYVTSFVITHRSGNCIDHTAERSQGRHVVGGGMEVRAGGRFEARAGGGLYHQPPPTHSRVLTPKNENRGLQHCYGQGSCFKKTIIRLQWSLASGGVSLNNYL